MNKRISNLVLVGVLSLNTYTGAFAHQIENNTNLLDRYFLTQASFCKEGYEAKNVLQKKEALSKKYEKQNDFILRDKKNVYNSVAFDFHIFAKDATLGVHTNGNVAVDNLVANNNFGTHMTNYKNKREDNYISNSASNINGIASNGNIVIGQNVATRIEDNGNKVGIGNGGNALDNNKSRQVYQEVGSSKYIDIDKELNNLKVISEKLSKRETSEGVEVSKVDGERQSIKVTSGNANNYLNVKASEISAGYIKRVLKIEIPEKTTLVINVDMNGVSKDQLENLSVSINNESNSESVIYKECGVLWNLYDSSNTNNQFVTSDMAAVGSSDIFMGTILAPSANIKYGALNGSVIAQKVWNVGKESHRWDFTGHEDDSYVDDEPGVEEPDTDKPGTDEPDTEEPDTDKPGTDEPDVEEPDTDKPGTDEPDVEEPDTDEPGTEEPDTDEPGTDEPDVEEPDTDKPGTDEPDVEEPDTDKPGTDEPDIDKLGIDRYEDQPATGDRGIGKYLSFLAGSLGTLFFIRRKEK